MSEIAVQPALITRVLPESIAAEVGFEPGDRLVAINGERPRDLIDYQFLCAEEVLHLEVLDAQGQTHEVEIEKDADDDLGLEFATALFDGLIQCNNRCPFCFIDQQPEGMRQSLYLKDDDYRLSFLYGSYLTLTNLSQREWERIARLRLSPLYVSVHATKPEVRIRLLKNPRAGKILEQIAWFEQQRLQIHAQVVVCPGINDGEHLSQTLSDLAQLHRGEVPAVASVAIVPVGLTRFRPDEDELVPVSPAKAQAVIAQVQPLQKQFQASLGSTFAWLADEWFLIAGAELPPENHYEDYPQIGNGVGSIRLFLQEFQRAARQLPRQISPSRRFTWIVGNAVEQAFQPVLERLNRVKGLEIQMVALASQYWGQTLTVTGLLTGVDLLRGLRGQDLGDRLLLPAVMLKHGDSRFLDDMTLATLQQELGVKIAIVGGGAQDLIDQCLQFEPEPVAL
uniref:FeS-containing oxidoreductase n=1 Tax=Cyanothece sp. (strain PCC 7425 / ATCC 29141) TaxID=395961 RepID=B8HSE4_CYAP4